MIILIGIVDMKSRTLNILSRLEAAPTQSSASKVTAITILTLA
jgi:hypothetical protein